MLKIVELAYMAGMLFRSAEPEFRIKAEMMHKAASVVYTELTYIQAEMLGRIEDALQDVKVYDLAFRYAKGYLCVKYSRKGYNVSSFMTTEEENQLGDLIDLDYLEDIIGSMVWEE